MEVNNLSFKGYQNIFCNVDRPVSEFKYITYLSAQLNNDDGHGDLFEFNMLKNMYENVAIDKNSDVLHFVYTINKSNGRDQLYLGSKEMLWGEELKQTYDICVPKFMSIEKYSEIEKFHLKAYTLLAGLTQRMMKISSAYEDIGIHNVLKSMHVNLSAILNNPGMALELVQDSCFKPVKFQYLAIALNTAISRTMKNFFR